RSLRLERPQQVTGVEVARFERPIENPNEDHVARHRRRREHVSVALLPRERLAAFRIEDMVEARIRRGEYHLPLRDSRRSYHPAPGVVESPFLLAGRRIDRIGVGVTA